MNILNYLDNEINKFRRSKGNYPSKIILNKLTKDKIFSYFESEPTIYSGWIFKKDNYRGIPLKIEEIDFIKLEG